MYKLSSITLPNIGNRVNIVHLAVDHINCQYFCVSTNTNRIYVYNLFPIKFIQSKSFKEIDNNSYITTLQLYINKKKKKKLIIIIKKINMIV